jgi:hypothetical protein
LGFTANKGFQATKASFPSFRISYYYFAYGSVYVCNFVSDIKLKLTGGVSEKNADEIICTEVVRSDEKLSKAAR